MNIKIIIAHIKYYLAWIVYYGFKIFAFYKGEKPKLEKFLSDAYGVYDEGKDIVRDFRDEFKPKK